MYSSYRTRAIFMVFRLPYNLSHDVSKLPIFLASTTRLFELFHLSTTLFANENFRNLLAPLFSLDLRPLVLEVSGFKNFSLLTMLITGWFCMVIILPYFLLSVLFWSITSFGIFDASSIFIALVFKVQKPFSSMVDVCVYGVMHT